MTEILTESFCERCGTRYTFESARPKVRLKGVKVLSRGLKNFVLSDDTSIDEAMAAARSEADREASAHQLDAFHKTFNFCMSCRQYTCPNCWNEAEARCLSCAPLALPEIAADVHDLRELRQAILTGVLTPDNGTVEHEQAPWETLLQQEASPEPEPEPAAAEVAATDVPVAEGAAAESVPADVPAAETPVAAADSATAEHDDAAGKAVSQTLGLLQRFRPGQSLDAELDAYERDRGDAASIEAPADSAPATDDLVALQADRIAAAIGAREPAALDAPAEAEPEWLEEPPAAVEAVAPGEEPEPVQAADAPALTDTTTEPEPAPAAAPELPEAPPLAAASAADVVEQPMWRITAPDPTGAAPSTPAADQRGSVPLQASGSPARSTTGEPQWPARPEGPASTGAGGLPFLGRPATPQGGIDALWAASNQELVTAPPVPGKAASGIQPCISCGLSLSATARFCRRCGTLQGR
jgi:hypothetical protein